MDKKLIVLIFFILFYYISIAQKIIYSKGRIYSDIPINQVDSNGFGQGIWVYVFKKNKYYSVVKLRNDTIIDTAKVFSLKNKLLNITMYKNGMQNGFYYDYDEKGRIKEERHYVNDTLNGVLKEYYNGKIYREAYYENNYPTYEKYYYNNGNIHSEYYSIIRKNELINKKIILDTLNCQYYRNGNLKSKTKFNYYENDSLLYEEYFYRRDGSLKTKIIHHKDKKEKYKYRKK